MLRNLKHPPLGPLTLKPLLGPLLKHPLLGPLTLKHPLLGPLLRLRRSTKSESTSSGISYFGATSPYTNLETAVDKGDAADRIGLPQRPYLHALPHLPTAERQPGQLQPRWRWRHHHVRWPPQRLPTDVDYGSMLRPRKTSPLLWQRQPPVAAPAPCHLRKLRHVCVSGSLAHGTSDGDWGFKLA